MPTSSYDFNCQFLYQYNVSGSLATTSEVCDVPLMTHAGYMFSFVTVLVIAAVTYWFIYYPHRTRNY